MVTVGFHSPELYPRQSAIPVERAGGGRHFGIGSGLLSRCPLSFSRLSSGNVFLFGEACFSLQAVGRADGVLDCCLEHELAELASSGGFGGGSLLEAVACSFDCSMVEEAGSMMPLPVVTAHVSSTDVSAVAGACGTVLSVCSAPSSTGDAGSGIGPLDCPPGKPSGYFINLGSLPSGSGISCLTAPGDI